jgi:hypothetical protein
MNGKIYVYEVELSENHESSGILYFWRHLNGQNGKN